MWTDHLEFRPFLSIQTTKNEAFWGVFWEDGRTRAGRDTKSAAPELAALMFADFFGIKHGLDQ